MPSRKLATLTSRLAGIPGWLADGKLIFSETPLDRLATILESLAKSQRILLRVADTIPSDQWKTPPREGAWSAGEVAAHLIMVEREVLRAADRITQKQPRKLPFWKKLRLPPTLVETRFVRLKSPMPVAWQAVNGKEETLAELREMRGRTLAFLDETQGRDLSRHRWKHPFLGWLDTYEWFAFLAAHEVRHGKQMKEISTSLPKGVESLQK